MAGLFARDVMRGNRTFLEAAHEITVWVANFTEKVIGDDIDAGKAVAKLAEFIRKDVASSKKAALPIGWDDGLTDEMKADYGLVFDPEDMIWSLSQIQGGFMRDLAEDPDPASKGFLQAVDNALGRITRNEKLTSIEINSIFRLILSHAKNTMTIAVLNRGLKEFRQGEVEGVNHAEVAHLLLAYLSRFGELRHHDGRFWQWMGACWEELDDQEVEKVIATEFGHFPCTRKQNDYVQVRKALGLLCKKPLKSDTAPPGLNFANGYLTEDLELVPHHPDHGATYVLPFCYRPEIAGQMPRFGRMLETFWGRDSDFDDKMAALQEAMGATLFGQGPTYTRALLLVGPAETGKTTLVDVVRGLLPPNSASAVPPEEWSSKYRPAEMAGKIVNFAGELSESKYISGAIFKNIIEGQTVQVERKNKDPFDMEPQAMHWFCSNFLPRTKDTSGGFSRRWLILEFRHPVPQAEKVLKLAEEIVAEEAEAIVAWAVMGYVRLREQEGYTIPASHEAVVDRMNCGNSSLYHYLSTSPALMTGRGNTSASIPAKDLYEDYTFFSFSEKTGYRLDYRSFQAEMDQFSTRFGFERFEEGGKLSYRYIELKRLGV